MLSDRVTSDGAVLPSVTVTVSSRIYACSAVEGAEYQADYGIERRSLRPRCTPAVRWRLSFGSREVKQITLGRKVRIRYTTHSHARLID
jgi:hypothetical protein